jgi:hypothetical protein
MVADDMGKRYSLFYILGSVASAFAGIVAYGVSIPLGGKVSPTCTDLIVDGFARESRPCWLEVDLCERLSTLTFDTCG